MENDRDILEKADALLRRHVPARGGPGEGADVPVLTELITPGGKARASTVAPESPPVAPVHAAAPDDEFRRALVAEVVNTVQARLAQDLEHRLTEPVLAEVRAFVAAALDDLRQEIVHAVDDAVARSLARHPPR